MSEHRYRGRTVISGATNPRACLSLLTAVCLACPPGVVKAAEPAAAAESAESAAPAEPSPNLPIERAPQPQSEPANTEPTPPTVPLYLNPASTQDPAQPNAGDAADRLTSREAKARDEQQFFRASKTAGIPVNSGVGLLSAGITTSLIIPL